MQFTMKVVRLNLTKVTVMNRQTLCCVTLLCWGANTYSQELRAELSARTLQKKPPVELSQQPWQHYRQFPELNMQYRDMLLGDKAVLGIQVKLLYRGRLSAFFQVLRDTGQATSWLDSARSVMLIARPSVHEDWVVTTFDTPWPLQPRDMVTCSRWAQAKDYSIEMTVVGCPQQWPAAANTIRIKQLSAQWLLTPLPNQQIALTYTGTADAGGGLPRWLSDPVALAATLRSFRALQQRLSQTEYQQALPEVCEPKFTKQGQVAVILDSMPCAAN